MDTLFGHGPDLTMLEMSMRALVVFFVTLALVRICGMRAFMHKSSFDTIIVIMLGAVLSRAIYGASPVLPIVAASLVLVVIHRVVAILTARFPAIERILKGHDEVLYRDGALDLRAMHRTGISRADLAAAVRGRGNRDALSEVREIHLESSGELTVIDPDPVRSSTS